ncbi:hypothetical protein, conserved [Eimeria praecox]|uniref:Peroxisomal membrane protein PEX16 n=1 Tax=Eimeria praecox TaxID=51316 RepID=U6GAW6_9EIME|nr:hypothetical protein, conserved [Eimeria praecox]
MPRKRWANTRPGRAHADASRAIPPSHENPSAISYVSEVSKESKFCTPVVSRAAPLKSESAPSTYGEDLTEREEESVSPPLALVHSVHTSSRNESASMVVSQEDGCSFHSPRSLPGDSSDAGGSLITSPPETQADSLCGGTVDNAEQLQRLPEVSDGGRASRSGTTQHSRLKNEQPITPNTQVAQQQQPYEAQPEQRAPVSFLQQQEQPPPEQKQLAATSSAAAALPRISPVSESEGEWIRVEEPRRQGTDAANPDDQTPSLLCQPSSAEVESPVPFSSCSALGAVREQDVRYPICIGSATQAEEGASAENSSIETLSGMVYGATSEADGWEASGASTSCIGTKPVQANRQGVLARLSSYTKSVACSLVDRLGAQQKQDPLSPKVADNSTEVHAPQAELSELNCQAKQGPRQRERLLQAVLEWHRCILEMYGGTVEDIARLALQVLPAHAADDRSERRFLIIQGVFDVFCLYRAHFLSPPGELLQAEALHHQWKIRRECSSESAGVSRLAGISRDPAVPLLGGRPLEMGANTTVGLPTSVRVALFGAISLALKIVRALQLLLEVSALRQGGEGPRFALCLRLELLKLVLKLMLRALTPFAFYCDEHSICQALAAHKEKQVISDSEKLRPFYGRRTGRKVPPLPSAARQLARDHEALTAAAAAEQLPRQWALIIVVWLFNELKASASPRRLCILLNRFRSTAWRPVLAEILYHIRPFIHLYLLRRARNTMSWTPWLVALFIEANSVSLLHGSPQVMEHLSPVEAAELHRRLTGVTYALLRPPFFDKFLARPVEAIDFVVRRVPLLNHFNVLDAFLAYRGLYFTTSNT